VHVFADPLGVFPINGGIRADGGWGHPQAQAHPPLTHAHPDHMAGIAKFQKAQVMALAAEVDVVEGRSSGGGPILRFRSPRPTGIRLSRTLQDGEVMFAHSAPLERGVAPLVEFASRF
jgi:hypothetical protein